MCPFPKEKGERGLAELPERERIPGRHVRVYKKVENVIADIDFGLLEMKSGSVKS